MSYNLIGYQQIAVDALSKKVTKLLNSGHGRTTLVFQSCTGSGKTIMTAKLIEAILEDNQDDKIAFLWVSIGKGDLHKQSKKKLDKVYDGFPPVTLAEDKYFGSKQYIPQNEVVVVNWEKLRSKDKKTGEWTNTIMKDGETTNFRTVLEQTKRKNKIICIIDESHIGADTIRTQELMEIIDADVVIEMSATPKFALNVDDFQEGKADKYKILPVDVIEAGMIKKDIVINPDIDKIQDDEMTSQNVVLLSALNKRVELLRLYELEGSDVNPLVLIQLPTGGEGSDKKDNVIGWLGEHGITKGNGKLQVWLSEEKTDDLEYISQLDNKTEFLIFKQAIAVGWDCPRAHILVKFREAGSQTFEIQTVGRILRMPEQKHYINEALNTGYIYSNLQSFTVKKEEYNPNIIKSLHTSKKENLENITLNSYYKQRVDYGDITSSFAGHLMKVWNNKLGLNDITLVDETVEIVRKKGIDLDVSTLDDSVVFDYQINSKDFDEASLLNHEISTDELKIFKTAENDLDSYFKRYVKLNLNGFAPKRSVGAVETAIYGWFNEMLGIHPRFDGVIRLEKIILHPTNNKIFINLLDEAVKSYRSIKNEEVRLKAEQSEVFKDIQILEKDYFNTETAEIRKNTKLYFYSECILEKSRSEQEKTFEDYVDKLEEKVEWWLKNGVSKDSYFGIKYIKATSEIGIFYPDYIVKFSDGRIGIFDTKSGNIAKEAKEKAEALQSYIILNKDKKLFGGIVTNTSTKDNPKLMINQNTNYLYDGKTWTDWLYLDEGL